MSSHVSWPAMVPLADRGRLSTTVAYLKERGIEVDEVAAVAGVTKPAVYQWCCGLRQPSRHLFRAVAQIAGRETAGAVMELAWAEYRQREETRRHLEEIEKANGGPEIPRTAAITSGSEDTSTGTVDDRE